MKPGILAGCIAYFASAAFVYGGEAVTDIPGNPDVTAKYIFYLLSCLGRIRSLVPA